MNIFDYNLYIFDLDGVIIDSEKHHWEAYKYAIGNDYDYFKKNKLSFGNYCKINHSIDYNLSFKNILNDDYDKVYKKKKEFYYSNLDKLKLINGFEKFCRKLIVKNKIICLVTDSSRETLKLLTKKFNILEKFHYVVTRDDVTKRKPSNQGYLKVLKKYSNINNYEIIGFEDSYKGFTAMSQVIFNTILVNNDNYYYYNNIKDKLNTEFILNYDNIDNYLIKNYDDKYKFYISSKTKYSKNWALLNKNFNIISNWIYINTKKEDMDIKFKQEICNLIFEDISNSDFLIFYTNDVDKDHYGSMIEIGIAISLKKKIYICGNNIYNKEVLFNFKDLMDYTYADVFDVKQILYQISVRNSFKYMNHNNNLQKLKIKEKISFNSYMNDKVIDYLVISASGKGTRLLPLTSNIPKILVSNNNNSLLNNIVNYWKEYTKKFVIIINYKYNLIVKFYMDLLQVDYEIINVESVKNYENSYTIHKALTKQEYLNKKILITWCDIYPNIKIDKNIFCNKNIIFTYKNLGRYEASNNKLIKKEYGNVIGIYYFPKFTYLNEFMPHMDLCDCYKKNFGNFETFEIEELIDIGDMKKLILYGENSKDKYVTRYFNKIIQIKDKLKKQSTCDYGNIIIEKEAYFYKYHKEYKFKPEIYDFGENYFIMEEIKNSKQAIIHFNESLQSSQFKILKKCLKIIEDLHNQKKITVENNIFMRDINIEFKSKIEKRLEKIAPILKYFSFLKCVNNKPIQVTHSEIIQKISTNIISFFEKNIKNYCTIHGDCHLSNILIDNNENYYLIDPRGYFGESDIFGINYYDIGKILYSLSGFDELNNRKNHYFVIEQDNIIVNINNNMDNYLVLFEKYNVPILIDMVILHWLGLAEYSKNNIHKCVSAYYYGIYLYQKYYLK